MDSEADLKKPKGHDDVENPSTLPSNIRVRSGWTVSLIMSSMIAAMGSFNFGYNISVINSTKPLFAQCQPDASSWECFPVKSEAWGLVVSMMSIGAIIGSLSSGSFANRFGRRLCMIVSSFPYIAGAALMAFAFDYWMLIAGRLLVGIGVGSSCIVVPMFLSEISSSDNRGQITSAHQFSICTGLVVVELIALVGLAQPVVWRYMFGLTALPAIIQLIGILMYVKESPKYLAQQGDAVGTKSSLQFYRRDCYDEVELEAMLSDSEKQSDQSIESWGFTRLLQNWPIAGRSLTAAVLLHMAQQFSGINVVFYYSSEIFKSNDSSAGPSTVPAAISMLNFVMTIVAIWLVEKAGRRPLALISASGMILSGSMFIVSNLVSMRTLSIVSILSYVALFAVGMGPIPWLMMNELFPTQALGAAVSLAVATNWICNFMVGLSFDWFTKILGKWLFAPYIIFTILFTIFAWFRIPETKGRPISFL